MYYKRIFDTKTDNKPVKKSDVFNKCCWDNWRAAFRIKKHDQCLSHYTKISSKSVLNLHPETVKLLKENRGSTLQDYRNRERPLGKDLKSTDSQNTK